MAGTERFTMRAVLGLTLLAGLLGPSAAQPLTPVGALLGGPVQQPPDELPPLVPSPAVLPAQPKGLGLDELLQLASKNSPEVAAAHARTEAARGRLIQAGLYPNP